MPSWIVAAPKPKRPVMGLQVRRQAAGQCGLQARPCKGLAASHSCAVGVHAASPEVRQRPAGGPWDTGCWSAVIPAHLLPTCSACCLSAAPHSLAWPPGTLWVRRRQSGRCRQRRGPSLMRAWSCICALASTRGVATRCGERRWFGGHEMGSQRVRVGCTCAWASTRSPGEEVSWLQCDGGRWTAWWRSCLVSIPSGRPLSGMCVWADAACACRLCAQLACSWSLLP